MSHGSGGAWVLCRFTPLFLKFLDAIVFRCEVEHWVSVGWNSGSCFSIWFSWCSKETSIGWMVRAQSSWCGCGFPELFAFAGYESSISLLSVAYPSASLEDALLLPHHSFTGLVSSSS